MTSLAKVETAMITLPNPFRIDVAFPPLAEPVAEQEQVIVISESWCPYAYRELRFGPEEKQNPSRQETGKRIFTSQLHSTHPRSEAGSGKEDQISAKDPSKLCHQEMIANLQEICRKSKSLKPWVLRIFSETQPQ